MARIYSRKKGDTRLSEVVSAYIGDSNGNPVEVKDIIRKIPSSILAGEPYQLYCHRDKYAAVFAVQGEKLGLPAAYTSARLVGSKFDELKYNRITNGEDVCFWGGDFDNEYSSVRMPNVAIGYKGATTLQPPHKFEGNISLYDGYVILRVRMDEEFEREIQLSYSSPASKDDVQCCKCMFWNLRQTFVVYVGNRFYEVSMTVVNNVFTALNIIQTHTFGVLMSYFEVSEKANSIRVAQNGTNKELKFYQIASDPNNLQLTVTRNVSYDYDSMYSSKNYLFYDDTRIGAFDATTAATAQYMVMMFTAAGAQVTITTFRNVPAFLSTNFSVTKFRKIGAVIMPNTTQSEAKIWLIVDTTDVNYLINKDKIFEVTVNLSTAAVLSALVHNTTLSTTYSKELVSIFEIETGTQKSGAKKHQYLFTDRKMLIANNNVSRKIQGSSVNACLLLFDFDKQTMTDITEQSVIDNGLFSGFYDNFKRKITRIDLAHVRLGSTPRGNV